MDYAELLERVAERSGLTPNNARRALDSFSRELIAAIRAGNAVRVPGVGKFGFRVHLGRNYKNPRTGEVVHVAPRRLLSLSAPRRTNQYLIGGPPPLSGMDGDVPVAPPPPPPPPPGPVPPNFTPPPPATEYTLRAVAQPVEVETVVEGSEFVYLRLWNDSDVTFTGGSVEWVGSNPVAHGADVSGELFGPLAPGGFWELYALIVGDSSGSATLTLRFNASLLLPTGTYYTAHKAINIPVVVA